MGTLTEHRLATPNYSYEKRQRELAKKRKNEEKKQRKAQRGSEEPSQATDDPSAEPVSGEGPAVTDQPAAG
jgi:hypothetical protein